MWTKNFPGGTNGFDKMSPVIDKKDNNNIFIGLNADNKILQLDASGTKVREYDLGTGKNMSWKVALADTSGDNNTDTLYAASGDGKQLYAFDTVGPNAGNVKIGGIWPVTVGTASHEIVESPPFVHKNGNVYVMTNGGDTLPSNPFPPAGTLHGYKADGTRVTNAGGAFTYPINFSGKFTGGFAEATDGTLIVTGYGAIFNDKSIQAVDPLSGTDKWRVEHGTGGTEFGAVKGPPLIVGNSVVVNTDLVTPAGGGTGTNGRVVAIDLTTQLQTTLYNSPGSMEGGPAKGKSEGIGHATATDAVFVATSNGMAAIAVGGGTLWTVGGFNATTCTPVYDSTNNLVWVTDDDDGDVVAMRTVAEGGNAAGTEKHRISPQTGGGLPAAAGSKSSPAIDSSGNVYLGYNNGNVTRISASGTPITLQEVNVGTGFTSAPLPTDITLTQKTGTLGAIGTLAVDTVTRDDGSLGGVPGSLRVTFKGAAIAAGATYEVTAPSSTITPPTAVTPRGNGYSPTEGNPDARVLAQGIGDKSATLKNGLVALFDGNDAPPTGAGTITDSSGAGNNGNVAAGQVPTHETTDRRSGGGAYVFDGSNDKINLGTLNTEIGNSATTGPKNELTISAWVYHENSGDDRIVCKSPGVNVANHIFSLGVTNGDVLRMRIGTDTTNATEMDGGNIPVQEWTHVAMTYDGANVKSYINGSLDSTHALTGNIKTSPDNVYIGNVNNTRSRNFDGKLDDVGIWNRALLETDIKEIAGPGDLTAKTSINGDGTLTVTPESTSGILATTGPFTIEVDDGVLRNPDDFTKTSDTAYTFGDTAPKVSISGTDVGDLKATATIDTLGNLDIKFTPGTKPTGTTDLTLKIDDGVGRLGSGFSIAGSGFAPGETPAVTISGGMDGSNVAGTATVNGTGTLIVDLSGVRTDDLTNRILTIAAGNVNAPDDFTKTSDTAYTSGDTAPNVSISGADVGNLKATATINALGNLDIKFTPGTKPTGTTDLTVKIDDGVGRLGSGFSIAGSGFAPGETPAVTISGGMDGSNVAGTATVNGTGTLIVDLSGVRTDDLTNRILTIAAGNVNAPDDFTKTSDTAYTSGDTAPNVSISGADVGNLKATATINALGNLDIKFTPGTKPTGTTDLTVKIDDGIGRLGSGFSVSASGYAPGETPVVTIAGGSGSSGTATASVDGTGTLSVDLSAVRTNDLGTHTVQIAPGATLQTPADVTVGDFHDPTGPPPTVNLSGPPSGPGLTATATVQPDGKVKVSFVGTPTTAGTLNVEVLGAGGTGSTAVSSKYLLDIDGDLWDYTVSEFESFTELVSDARAQNGAEQNSLGTFWELLSTNVNKLEQAAGRIKDADFAKEMTEVSKSQINTRSAAVMLGKQNRITSEALLTLQNLSNML